MGAISLPFCGLFAWGGNRTSRGEAYQSLNNELFLANYLYFAKKRNTMYYHRGQT